MKSARTTSPAGYAAAFLAFLLTFGCASSPEPTVSNFKKSDEVQFFPTLARLTGGEWEVPLHGWVFEKEDRTVVLALFEKALGMKIGELKPDERQIFEKRALWFMTDNHRGRIPVLSLCGRRVPSDKSAPNGHFFQTVRFPAASLNGCAAAGQTPALPFQAIMPDGDTRVLTGSAFLLPGEGLSVISDIDDTIKISEVRDKAKLLRNTFAKEFQAVPGMAEAYRRLQSQKAFFHYVSASPYQLFPDLREFVQKSGFPEGSFHLKTFRWKDETFFSLFMKPEQYKESVIVPLIERYPGRKYILIGDSGEKDPEAYGAVARRFPDKIQKIWIRNVTDESRTAARYAEAFKGVPAALWEIFEKPGF